MTPAPLIDEALAAGLLARQFPQWCHLALSSAPSAGTDNAIFRLGDRMAVRLPKIDWAADQPGREHTWLPLFAGRLPLAIPTPIALGAPDLGYPWQWSVCGWLEGDTAIPKRLLDPDDAATALGGFIAALRRIDSNGAPRAGPTNHYRGAPLAALDSRVREALAALDGRVDVGHATAAWDLALATPPWAEAPVWLHGDLHPQNLLAAEGRLSAVIDFGLMAAGDPATDLTAAWSMFGGTARNAFRAAAEVDDDTWSRGRGWALYTSLVILPYYWDTNPVLVRHALGTVAELLAEGG